VKIHWVQTAQNAWSASLREPLDIYLSAVVRDQANALLMQDQRAGVARYIVVNPIDSSRPPGSVLQRTFISWWRPGL